MKKNNSLIFIGGIIVGVLIVLFLQFHFRMTVQNNRISNLEQAVNTNSKTLTEVVGFINQGIQANQTEETTIVE